MRVLVTGPTGFVGRELVKKLSRTDAIELTLAVRSRSLEPRLTAHVVGEISAETSWASAVVGQQVVIHAAARAHIQHRSARWKLYYLGNAQGVQKMPLG